MENLNEPVRYYHGGIPGFKKGDYILPPKETDTPHTLIEYAEEYCKEIDIQFTQRNDRVYIATDVRAAIFFAMYYPGGGWVYEVVPEEPIEPDSDCTKANLSFQCPKAKIIKTLEPPF